MSSMCVFMGMDGKPVGHQMGLNDTVRTHEPNMWDKFHDDFETHIRLHPHGLPSESCSRRLREMIG